MQLKSLLVAAIVGLAGLSLSGCVDGGGSYRYGGYNGGYGGYNGGYYDGGGVIIGSRDHYRPRYRNDSYRYRGDHRQYNRPGRPQYSGRHPGYRYDGRPGDHHRRIPGADNNN